MKSVGLSWDDARIYGRRAWTPQWLAGYPKPVRIAVRTVAILILTLFLAWLVLFITKGRFLKHPFETIASSMLERDLSVGGDFQLYFDPLDIHFRAEKMAIANPDWAKERKFFTSNLIDTRISPIALLFGRNHVEMLTLKDARVDLEWDAKGARNSWTFGGGKARPFKLPLIERGDVLGTTLAYSNPAVELFAKLEIATVAATDNRFDSEIRFTGDGTSHARPFKISGALQSPNETIAGGQNRLTLHAEAARTVVDLAGTLPGATQFEGAQMEIGVHGFNLAELFDFAGIVVPETRAYRLGSSLTYDGNEWKFTGLKGVFGDSDLAGSLRIGMPGDRLKLTADLKTNTLDIIDAGPFIGFNPERLDQLGAKGAITQEGGHGRVLPDAPLRIDAISQFDADVHYRVARVRAESFPMSDIDLALSLDHALLELKPFKANLAGGTLAADIELDARNPVVQTTYDIRLSPTPMGRLLARFGVEQSGTTGTIAARLSMKGSGNSLRASLSSSNGRIAIIMPQGTMWARNIQLSELDIGTFVQKMFEKKLKEPVQINCGLIAFSVRNGVAAADPILIDTKKNLILGYGGFSFKSEAIDMSIRADAKTFSLFSGQSPVGLDGYFASPKVDPISGELVARAGVGIGLAAFASPIAGILAFIDPGDAKSAACGPVLQGARASAQHSTNGEKLEVSKEQPKEDKRGSSDSAKSDDSHKKR